MMSWSIALTGRGFYPAVSAGGNDAIPLPLNLAGILSSPRDPRRTWPVCMSALGLSGRTQSSAPQCQCRLVPNSLLPCLLFFLIPNISRSQLLFQTCGRGMMCAIFHSFPLSAVWEVCLWRSALQRFPS